MIKKSNFVPQQGSPIVFLGKILYLSQCPSPSPRCKPGRCSGGRNLAMGYELIWGRQWLPHTWKPHVITVVHLLNSPVLNGMINSCKQYCLCDNVYSYLIFILYFTMSWSKGWHCVITRKWIEIWLMTKKANDCGCNNLFIYSSRYYWIRSNLQFWVIKVDTK